MLNSTGLQRNSLIEELGGRIATPVPTFNVHHWIGILRRQHKIVWAIVLLTAATVALLLGQLDHRFTSTAVIVIDESEAQLVGINPGLSADSSLNNRIDTEVEILKSSSVALDAIEQLKLWNDPEFGLELGFWRQLLNVVTFKKPQQTTKNVASLAELTADQRAILVDKLSEALRITRRGLTSVITIGATSLDPAKAAHIANSIAEAYVNLQIRARASTAQRAADFLQQRVDELARAIHENDSKIDTFIATQSTRFASEEARTEASRLRAQISENVSKRSNWSDQLARLERLQASPSSNVGSLSFAPEIQKLVAERNQVGANAATSAEAKLGLDDVHNQLRLAAESRSADLHRLLNESETQLNSMRVRLQTLIAEQPIPSDVTVEFYRLQRDSETVRKLYDNYVTRLAEAQQKISLALPESRLVAPAIVAHEPSFPPTKLIVALAFCFALGLGGGAALLRENFVGGFTSAEHLESVTQLPVIAAVPRHNEQPHNMILTAPFSSYAESIRRLRIGIENLIEPGRSNVILLTSTNPGEGKTTLALSLARALAMSGRRTLLLDCDLRHPSISLVTGHQSPVNLLDILVSQSIDSLNFSTSAGYDPASGLHYIGAAATQKHSSDILLASPKFEQLVERAKSEFEVIVLDSPPVGYVVDARVVTRFADLILYIVRYGRTSQRTVMSALREMLSEPKPVPAALVLNNAQTSSMSYYYSGKVHAYYRG